MWREKKKATTNQKALPVVVNIVILQQAKKLCVQHFLLTGGRETEKLSSHPLPSHYTGCVIGIFIMAYFHNPHKTW